MTRSEALGVALAPVRWAVQLTIIVIAVSYVFLLVAAAALGKLAGTLDPRE